MHNGRMLNNDTTQIHEKTLAGETANRVVKAQTTYLMQSYVCGPYIITIINRQAVRNKRATISNASIKLQMLFNRDVW